MTTTHLAIGAAALLALLLLARIVLRGDRGNEVERFHRARTMTTTWAEEYRGSHTPGTPAGPASTDATDRVGDAEREADRATPFPRQDHPAAPARRPGRVMAAGEPDDRR